MKKNFYVLRLCILCKNIHTIWYGFGYFIGTGLLVGSIYMLIESLFEDDLSNINTQVFLVGYLILLIAGALLLYDQKKRKENCTVCDSEKTLIAVDTPLAIEIIKEKDLTIPEEKKFPWQT